MPKQQETQDLIVQTFKYTHPHEWLVSLSLDTLCGWFETGEVELKLKSSNE